MSDDKSVPRPGHFLPGGAGDGATAPEPPSTATAGQTPLGLSKPEALPQDGHAQQHSYGWSAARKRGEAPPPPFQSERRFSKPMIAGFAALALLVATGGAALAAQLIRSYDDLVENPLSNPSVRTPSSTPSGSEPTPTAEPSGSPTPTPDAMIVKQNKLYATGKLTPSKCKEPAIRPTSKANVGKYAKELIRCLDLSWASSVRKAGYEFRSPALILEAEDSACEKTDGDLVTAYCNDGQTIYVPWKRYVDEYPKHKLGTRVMLSDGIAYVYGHHVQYLTGVLDAWGNRRDVAPTKKAELEEVRRFALQAACFGAMYMGANRQWYPLRGRALNEWKYQASHGGDEYSKDKIPDHGSRKSQTYWNQRGFLNMDPKYCNTFAAPPAQVS